MPSAIQDVIRRRVIEQWLSGESRDKIASDLQIGTGTVSSIVSDFKKNLQASDLDSVRELAIDAKRQGLSLSDLASHFRLYRYFRNSGEEKVESFITNVHLSNIPSEKVIEYLNQIHEITKSQSVPPNELPKSKIYIQT